MSTKTVHIDGIDYHTLFERPSEDAPCVLLCHALMSNLHMWDHTVKTLHEAGFATLRYDHVGHNQTTAPQDSKAKFTMDALVHHMHQLVREATDSALLAAVIGCSIGGVMALRYGMLYTQDVDRVISVAAPGITAPEIAKELWSKRIEQFEKDVASGGDSLCYATVERWFPGDGPSMERARAEAFKHVKTCTLPGYRILADSITKYDYAGDLDKLRGVPCLVVAGSEDAAGLPKLLEELAEEITGSQFVSMQGVGHLPPLQEPEEFGRILLQYLDE